MHDIETSISGLGLCRPSSDRDAPFALSWFKTSHGEETLLLMGNPKHKIKTPSLREEENRIREFLKLEKENHQLTWMVRYDNKTIGAVWIELQNTEYVKSPAFHIMIGDKNYRNKGFGKAIMQEMIDYAKNTLKVKVLYSRYLTSNKRIAHLDDVFGFIKDDSPYTDNDGLEFQNVKLEL